MSPVHAGCFSSGDNVCEPGEVFGGRELGLFHDYDFFEGLVSYFELAHSVGFLLLDVSLSGFVFIFFASFDGFCAECGQ